MKHLILAAAAASIALAGQAGATDLSKPETLFGGSKMTAAGATVSWTGAYVGIQGGYSDTHYSGAGSATSVVAPEPLPEGGDKLLSAPALEIEPPAPETVTVPLSGRDGAPNWFGGFVIGADRQIGQTVVGVFADVNFSAEKIRMIAGEDEVKGRSPDYQFDVGGRLGYLTAPNLLVFAELGYAQMKLDETYQGLMAGAGAEYRLTSNVSITGEYRHTWYGDAKVTSEGDTDTITIKHKLDDDRVLAGVRYRFQ